MRQKLLDMSAIENLPLHVIEQILKRSVSLRRDRALRLHKNLRLFASRKKNGNGSGDLTYLVPTDTASLRVFSKMYRDLGFQEWLPSASLMSAYFMTRSYIRSTSWHTDSKGTGDKMRNIIVPLEEIDCHLLVKTDGAVHVREYKLGQAVVNYDSTIHSSQPGRSATKKHFLVFMCGDATMTALEWRNAVKYVKNTCPVYKVGGRVCESDVYFYDSDEEVDP